MQPASSRLVYLAGSALELHRARDCHSRLVQADITVVSTWIANIERVGSSNPRDATVSQRAAWAVNCLNEVARADIVWLLVPPTDQPTRGAWAEIGYAYGGAKTLIASGDTKQSIFCALTQEYERDEDAFAAVVAEATWRLAL